MLPSACGLGQHFQDLGHSFSLYGPPSRQITYIYFSFTSEIFVLRYNTPSLSFLRSIIVKEYILCNLPVWVCLVIEFEPIISIREVLLRLFFDIPIFSIQSRSLVWSRSYLALATLYASVALLCRTFSANASFLSSPDKY